MKMTNHLQWIRMANIWFYNDDVGLVQFIGIDDIGCPIDFFVSKKITGMKWLITDFARPTNLQWERNGPKYVT